jgi:hypothetical protein
MSELLSCPFCGGEASVCERHEEDGHAASRPHRVYYVGCCAKVSVESHDWWSANVAPPESDRDREAKSRAINAWNRRASSPVAPAGSHGDLGDAVKATGTMIEALTAFADHGGNLITRGDARNMADHLTTLLAACAQPPAGEAEKSEGMTDLQWAVYTAAYATLRDYANHPLKDRGLINAGDRRIPLLIADQVERHMKALAHSAEPAAPSGPLRAQERFVPGGGSSQGVGQ